MRLEIIFCNLNVSLSSILKVRETVFCYRFSIDKLFLCIYDGILAATHFLGSKKKNKKTKLDIQKTEELLICVLSETQ